MHDNKVRWGVVVFPGSNCDQDCYNVIVDHFGDPVEYLWHKNTTIPEVDILFLPGGFSYGDYYRPGAVASHAPILLGIQDYVASGGMVLGICNGFQVLLELGLLPGALVTNTSGRFFCRSVGIEVVDTHTPFTQNFQEGEHITLPVAHRQGRYYLPEGCTKKPNVVFRYAVTKDVLNSDDVNGSWDQVAGISGYDGRVMGLMPHPERACSTPYGEDGLRMLQGVRESIYQRKVKQGGA